MLGERAKACRHISGISALCRACPSSTLLAASVLAPAVPWLRPTGGDHPGPDWSKIMDVIMLWIVGGRQRNRSEHEQLLNKAGFRLERVIQTMSDVTILEAVAAH